MKYWRLWYTEWWTTKVWWNIGDYDTQSDGQLKVWWNIGNYDTQSDGQQKVWWNIGDYDTQSVIEKNLELWK